MADLKILSINGVGYNVGFSTNDFSNEAKAKLDGIAEGAQVNVLEGVQVNGAALAIANKLVNILITSGSANGTISVNGIDVAIKGLAALAYKAEISEAELSAALKAVIDAKAEQSSVDTLSGKIDVLNGTGEGSVSKAITDAFNDFATKVTDDGVVNSYKELIDWVATHGSEASEMAGAITAIQSILAGIGGDEEPATVKAAIEAGLTGKVDKVEGYGLSKNDFTDALKEKLDGISLNANKIEFSYNGDTETLIITTN